MPAASSPRLKWLLNKHAENRILAPQPKEDFEGLLRRANSHEHRTKMARCFSVSAVSKRPAGVEAGMVVQDHIHFSSQETSNAC